MNRFIDKLKNFINGKNELSTVDLYNQMEKTLQQAEDDIGGNFFPKDENLLTTEQIHYSALGLNEGADFSAIKDSYKKLKEQYYPEKYRDNNENYQKFLELDTRIEIAYKYFKNKFNIGE